MHERVSDGCAGDNDEERCRCGSENIKVRTRSCECNEEVIRCKIRKLLLKSRKLE